MARLFITPREIDYIADVTKELTKDVIGQKIYYYKVREDLTDVHDVYEEAPEKIFDPPVELCCLVGWEPTVWKTDKFGSEARYAIDVDVQARDMLDKGIDCMDGDFFSYGDTFYEIVQVSTLSQVYGQIEHATGYKLSGKQAREGLINFIPHGPTDESYADADAVQETFVQQRGLPTNRLGPTGDVRSLQTKGVVTGPISGPAEVSPKGGNGTKDEQGYVDSSFYTDS